LVSRIAESPRFTVVSVFDTLAPEIGANNRDLFACRAVLIRMFARQNRSTLRLIDVSKEGKTIDALSYPL